MIGIVVPAHNEQAHLNRCLAALTVAAGASELHGEAVHILVVLDDCCDGSRNIVACYAEDALPAGCTISYLESTARNVGIARAAGAAILLSRGARWLAFTDADTTVSPTWLATQLSLDADAVCGSIAVDDWSGHQGQGGMLREHFARTYTDADGHRHIHGANLGVSAAAYLRAGGFPPLACSEDVALVEALQRTGAHIAWSAAPRVVTSARRNARARGGFGDTLLAVVAASIATTLHGAPALREMPAD